MKKIYIAATLLIGIGSVSASAERIEPKEFKVPSCKGSEIALTDDAAIERNDEYLDPYDVPESWRMEYKDGSLVITWENYLANCCPDTFEAWMERVDDTTLSFNVVDSDGLCDCYCLFDVKAGYEGVAPGKYTVIFGNPIHQKFTAEVNVEDGMDITLGKIISSVAGISGANAKLMLTEGNIVGVKSAGKGTLDIYSANGHRYATLNVEGNTEVGLNTLPRGIYLLRLTDSEGSVNLRFIR